MTDHAASVTPRRRPDTRHVVAYGPAMVAPRPADRTPVIAQEEPSEPQYGGQAGADRSAFATIPGVELLDTGSWEASTGPFTATIDDLRAAVAAQDDPTLRAPVLKLGHTDPRFNGRMLRDWFMGAGDQLGIPAEVMSALLDMIPMSFDGQPSVGRVKNLRVDDTSNTLVGDYVGVPRWLADALPTAYPSRSIEAHWNYEAPSGRIHPFVITGVALLGESTPAVSSLEDIRGLMYGDEEEAET